MRIHRHRQQKPKYKIHNYLLNARIKAEKVRVFDDEGTALGVIPTEEALALAQAKELDLVEVSPKADPPVCKILDFGQFKYQKEKEAKKQRAQSKEVDIKGVRLGQALKFLERGDKVKIELPLRGRERAHRNVAQKVVERFIASIRETYEIRIEQHIAYQGGRMTAIVARA